MILSDQKSAETVLLQSEISIAKQNVKSNIMAARAAERCEAERD